MLCQPKADVQTKMIRVVIMTISTQERDLAESRRGANSYTREPADCARIGKVRRQLDCYGCYWLLPSKALPWGG